CRPVGYSMRSRSGRMLFEFRAPAPVAGSLFGVCGGLLPALRAYVGTGAGWAPGFDLSVCINLDDRPGSGPGRAALVRRLRAALVLRRVRGLGTALEARLGDRLRARACALARRFALGLAAG